MKPWNGFRKGINLGGWLSQSSLKKDHLDTFITKEDIKQIADWGLDHVRIPVDYILLQDEKGGTVETGFEYIDRCLQWCDEYNVNLIIEIHKFYGYYFLDGETDEGFFHNEKVIMRFINIWISIAKRYGSRPDRICFELLNAVMDATDQDSWMNIARSAISIIRVFAPTTKILVCGSSHSSVNAITTLSDFHDPNVGFSFHCYEPLLFCQQQAYWRDDIPNDAKMSFPVSKEEYHERLEKYPAIRFSAKNTCPDLLGPDYFKNLFQRAVNYVEKLNTIIYCVEYGAIDRADNASTLQWFKQIHEAFEFHGIGRALWTYKELDYGLKDQRFEGIREIILQYL
ncbi:glycoside hydrolase family 5 protein [Treponema sp.]|uniref:glycoside hydrolase family 5 protein n=1 Tax=Treponema sp. TaxID=166 RepID=UPI00298D6FA1|nr:cellulase family glycosylhydrolase [Treponema sp.]MCQ2240320.1 cellulase family glycosylhydrolase [Treponema sp.]